MDNGTITWAELAVKGNSGFVGGTVEYNKCLERAINEIEDVPLGSWHTHPDMGPFWSSTDESDDQIRTIENNRKMAKEGVSYFLVFDQLDWLLRTFHWSPSGVTYHEGKVSLDGTFLDMDVHQGKWASWKETNGKLTGDELAAVQQWADSRYGDCEFTEGDLVTFMYAGHQYIAEIYAIDFQEQTYFGTVLGGDLYNQDYIIPFTLAQEVDLSTPDFLQLLHEDEHKWYGQLVGANQLLEDYPY